MLITVFVLSTSLSEGLLLCFPHYMTGSRNGLWHVTSFLELVKNGQPLKQSDSQRVPEIRANRETSGDMKSRILLQQDGVY